MLKFCKKDFEFNYRQSAYLRTNEYLRLEARCIRLDGRGKVTRKEAAVGLGKQQNEEPCV
jgi:hypothetical protein